MAVRSYIHVMCDHQTRQGINAHHLASHLHASDALRNVGFVLKKYRVSKDTSCLDAQMTISLQILLDGPWHDSALKFAVPFCSAIIAESLQSCLGN